MRIVKEISDGLYKRADSELDGVKEKVEGILNEVELDGFCANKPKMNCTVKRVPLMTGLPTIIFGSMTMRSNNPISFILPTSEIKIFYQIAYCIKLIGKEIL